MVQVVEAVQLVLATTELQLLQETAVLVQHHLFLVLQLHTLAAEVVGLLQEVRREAAEAVVVEMGERIAQQMLILEFLTQAVAGVAQER